MTVTGFKNEILHLGRAFPKQRRQWDTEACEISENQVQIAFVSESTT